MVRESPQAKIVLTNHPPSILSSYEYPFCFGIPAHRTPTDSQVGNLPYQN